MHVRWIAIVEEERKGCTGHSLRLKYFFILVRQCALCDPIVLISVFTIFASQANIHTRNLRK